MAKTKQVSQLVTKFKAARRAAAPIISISTPDAAATMREICDAVKDVTSDETPIPKMRWDIISGLIHINEAGKNAIAEKGLADVQFETDLVREVVKVPTRSIVFVLMASRFMSGDDGTTREFIQGLWNIRDQFKGNKRTIVLLDQDVQVPVELQKDVIPLVEKLPSKDSLREIILRQYKNTNIKVEEDKLDRAIESIVGLSAFQSEQVAAMSMTASGLNVDEMWDMKRALIEDTPGLSINRESFKYDDIGGLDSAKEFLKLYFGGKRRPTCIIFIDEIEKAMAGQNDSTGISQDQLGQMLQFMQNSNSTGALFAGHSGSGKSALAKATGGEFDVPVLELDFNAMKGGIVGTSETNLRNAIKVIDSVAGGGMNALFIATSNNLSMIPPELKSRFKLGTFMFDLPTAEEQKPIWAIHKKKNGISSRAKLPPHDNWTGREIENCCSLADAFETDLVKAAKYIVPVSVSDEKKVERLRHQAHGRWMDSTKGGIYRMPNNAASHQNGTDRTVSLGDDE